MYLDSLGLLPATKRELTRLSYGIAGAHRPGVKELFVVQCSIVIFDRWLGFAHFFLQMTNGN
jgi:hypothetical protein